MSKVAPKHPLVLSIGTTDPWVAAGINLDLYMAERLDVRLVTAIVGVSAQDGQQLTGIAAIAPDLLKAQLHALRDAPIAVVRIGAIITPGHVIEIRNFLKERPVPVVLDPVIATSSGGRLASAETVAAIEQFLFPYVTLLTPNLHEASIFAKHQVRSIGEMDAAAMVLGNRGPKAVVIKGGHLKGDTVDVFWDGEELRHLEAPRVPGDMRGTGCIFAITAAAAMAYGHPIRDAVRAARDVTRICLSVARDFNGMRVLP